MRTFLLSGADLVTGVDLFTGAALTSALASAAESAGQDQAWEFGLERILDGLGALIERRGAR